MERAMSFLGLLAMVFIAWLFSENRRRMNWRLILSGIALQIAVASLLLTNRYGKFVFDALKAGVEQLVGCAGAGPRWLIGENFLRAHPTLYAQSPFLNMVPPIIFISAVMAVLFHYGVMQRVVKLMARSMVWVMDTSGAESLCAAANVLLGMAEAPLVIRPYLATLTRSEIMALMTVGLATVAGGVMAAYVAMGIDAGHLLTASLLSAPAALVLAKVMVPETDESPTKGVVKIDVPRPDANAFDALCRGASEGMTLSLNMIAGLIAILGLVALLNWPLGQLTLAGGPLSLERICGWVFAPLAWLMGIEAGDATVVGSLLGKRLVTNEFIAYVDMARIKETMSVRSFTIATYAMCGFANLGSVAILIGGVGSLVPDRRREFATLGAKALLAGTLASFMTACIAGMLI